MISPSLMFLTNLAKKPQDSCDHEDKDVLIVLIHRFTGSFGLFDPLQGKEVSDACMNVHALCLRHLRQLRVVLH
jgi:hypothetical protein